jgi:hypothetical protein
MPFLFKPGLWSSHTSWSVSVVGVWSVCQVDVSIPWLSPLSTSTVHTKGECKKWRVHLLELERLVGSTWCFLQLFVARALLWFALLEALLFCSKAKGQRPIAHHVLPGQACVFNRRFWPSSQILAIQPVFLTNVFGVSNVSFLWLGPNVVGKRMEQQLADRCFCKRGTRVNAHLFFSHFRSGARNGWSTSIIFNPRRGESNGVV